MIKTETFLTQLINSVVLHLTEEADAGSCDFQAFMVRSELERRQRELMAQQPSMGISKAEKTLAVAAALFFNGDVQACKDQWELAAIEDLDACYEIQLNGIGRVQILAIDLEKDHRYTFD